MISIENTFNDGKPQFRVFFDKKVKNKMKLSSNDKVYIIQSKFNYLYFLMIKSDTGYKVKRFSKDIYEVNIPYKFEFISEFSLRECSYFTKKEGQIRIIINDINQIAA